MKIVFLFYVFCANVLSFCYCQDDFDYDDDQKVQVDYLNATEPPQNDKVYDENGGNNDSTLQDDNDGNNDEILQDDNDGANNNDIKLYDNDYAYGDDKDYLSDYDLSNKDKGNDEDDPNVGLEFDQGHLGDLLGSNLHTFVPQTYAYTDLGRRFIPVYPYFEKKYKQVNKQNILENSQEPVPKRAPPEVVLAMAQQAELLERLKPSNSDSNVEKKIILRSGDYWNSVWKEDVDPDPKPALRTNTLRKPLFKQKNEDKLTQVQAKVYSGSKLYSLLSNLKDDAPELLYLINVHDDK